MRAIPNITPEYILQNIDQQEVLSFYLDNQVIREGGDIINTIRGETTPSVSCLLTPNNIYYLKDFASVDYSGNCISWCKFYYKERGENLNHYQACRRIIEDLKYEVRDVTYTPINNKCVDKSYSTIKPKIRLKEFNLPLYTVTDLKYWTQFNANEKDLKRFKVYSLDSVYIKGKSTEYFVNNEDELMFGYKYPVDGKWQIYRPYANKESKWRINHEYVDVVGLQEAPKVLAKCRKGRIVLDKMGIQSMRFSSETYIPDSLPDSIQYILYDNDYNKKINQGQLSAQKINQKFGNKFTNIIIPDQYQSTDPPELVERVGFEEAKRIIYTQMNLI